MPVLRGRREGSVLDRVPEQSVHRRAWKALAEEIQTAVVVPSSARKDDTDRGERHSAQHARHVRDGVTGLRRGALQQRGNDVLSWPRTCESAFASARAHQKRMPRPGEGRAQTPAVERTEAEARALALADTCLSGEAACGGTGSRTSHTLQASWASAPTADIWAAFHKAAVVP